MTAASSLLPTGGFRCSGSARWRIRRRRISGRGAGSWVGAWRAGDVDLIEQVPPGDAKQLAANPKLSLFSIASTRIVYLAMDSARAQSPFVTDAAGKPLDRNPLTDSRVRQAV